MRQGAWTRSRRPLAMLGAALALGGCVCCGPRFFGDPGYGPGPRVSTGGDYPASRRKGASPVAPPSQPSNEGWSWQRQRQAWQEQARQPL